MPSAEYLSWRHWLRMHGQPQLEPRRWMYLNFTYQQIQAALAGQGVALARLALVHESLARGELVEPFGAAGRISSPVRLLAGALAGSATTAPEVRDFTPGSLAQAAATRAAIGEQTEHRVMRSAHRACEECRRVDDRSACMNSRNERMR